MAVIEDLQAHFNGKTPEQLLMPTDWDVALANEPPDVTERKMQRARLLDVPAILFLEDEVSHRIRELAWLDHHFADPHGGDRYLSVLNGAIPFMDALMRGIKEEDPNRHPIVQNVIGSRFGQEQNGRRKFAVRNQPAEAFFEDALRLNLGDEVIDEFITAEVIFARIEKKWRQYRKNIAMQRGLRILANKRIADLSAYNPEQVHVGFNVPIVWLFGWGMDGEDEMYRYNREIGISRVQKKTYQPAMEELLVKMGSRASFTMDDIEWI